MESWFGKEVFISARKLGYDSRSSGVAMENLEEIINKLPSDLHLEAAGFAELPAIQQIARLAAPVFQKHKIKKAILFGSFARGTQTKKSDLDLILIQETPKRYLERSEGILEELYKAIAGRDIELFIYTPAELEAMMDRPFIKKALSEGHVIYEQGKTNI